MTNLVSAYMRNEIREFEKILRTNQQAIMGDAFIRMYIEDLLKNIRTQVLLKVVTPYTRIRIAFIADELNIKPPEVEALLMKGGVRAAAEEEIARSATDRKANPAYPIDSEA